MSEPKVNDRMEKIVSLCKRRGLIFQSSEIYGGINGFWDYGPLGAELKRNIKDYWWRCMTQYRDDVVGLEATIIMHPKIWEASGHTSTFSDPMVDCLLSKKRFRADQIDPQSGTAYHYTGSKDETSGKVTNWAFEMGAPAVLTRSGWKRSSLKIGDVVTVEGSMARDGSKHGNARNVVMTATGEKLGAGSSEGNENAASPAAPAP